MTAVRIRPGLLVSKKREIRSKLIRDGVVGVLIFTFFIVILLFGNNAGWWRATEGPMFGFLMFFGWPFVLGSAIGGLMAWGGGSPMVAIVLTITGLVVNVVYALGVGLVIGWAFKRK